MKALKYTLASFLILAASCASPQKKHLSLESKIPTNGKVKEVTTKYYHEPFGKITLKRLENEILITDIDYDADGTIEGRFIRQQLSNGVSISELDINADGTIEKRATFYSDWYVEFEDLLPDGSVKKERYSLSEPGEIITEP